MPNSQASQDKARIRLLKFVALFGVGGTERQFVNLGLGLDAARFDLEFACLRRWGQLLPEVEARGIPVEEYHLTSFLSARAMRQQVRLARDIARRRVQIVHAYNFYGNVFAVPAAYVAGAPVIIAAIRDHGVYMTPAQVRAQRVVCRLADCVLVNAEAIRSWLVDQGYEPSRIVTIRNGLDAARFAAPRTAGLRAALGVPEGAPIVSMMSRLTQKKGLEDFLEAGAVVAVRHPDARFLIVGQGQQEAGGPLNGHDGYRATLVERARQLGLADKVIFTGYRSDVPALLAETAIAVLPSWSEGLSNALLEAMAAGVPVVASRVGGTPEAVEDGVTGLLVPARDPRTLAEAIGRLLVDPLRAIGMGRAGRAVVAERYSVERMVRTTEQLYRDLLLKKLTRPDWRTRLGVARTALVLAGKQP